MDKEDIVGQCSICGQNVYHKYDTITNYPPWNKLYCIDCLFEMNYNNKTQNFFKKKDDKKPLSLTFNGEKIIPKAMPCGSGEVYSKVKKNKS